MKTQYLDGIFHNSQSRWKRVTYFCGMILGGLFLTSPARGQILPDNTLNTPSIVTLEEAIQRITGGTQAGNNLFHSFEQFNLQTGETAHFDHPLTIENIITRVTGGQGSSIDGSIRANGIANLFLLNPNGIVLGENARLEIGGSFVGSSADRLLFEDGSFYSATETGERSPLLSVNVPIGLQVGQNPGAIVHRARNFQVPSGQTLALVGGLLRLEGGTLSAPEGRIELGSVIGDRLGIGVGIPGISLSYEGGQNFQDITLSNGAMVDASGEGGGSIQVRGRNLTLAGGSQIRANTLGTRDGGTLTVTASESVRVTEGSQVQVNTFGSGSAGILTVRALESVELIGRNRGIPSALQSRVEATAIGNGGNIEIETNRLQVAGGARVAVSSLTIQNLPRDANGQPIQGNGGSLQVRASQWVEIDGVGLDANMVFRSSALSAVAAGEGNGGNAIVESDRLRVTNGGQVTTSTFASGDAGDLMVRASEVDAIGRTSLDVGNIPSGLLARVQPLGDRPARGGGGDLRVTADRLRVRDNARVAAASQSAGNSGNVTLNVADGLEVSNLGEVSVRGLGLGEAGTLEISGDRGAGTAEIRLEGGFLAASSETGTGGNIELRSPEIQLRRDSEIAATGSTVRETRDGNIAIEAEAIVLFEGSAIRTNAADPKGGSNIDIRPLEGVGVAIVRHPESTVQAAGKLTVEGEIEFDPAAIPEVEIVATETITRGCAGGGDSQFSATGRGGLLPTPYEPLDHLHWLDDIDLPREWEDGQESVVPNPSQGSIVEAQGWIVNDGGQVVLVASRPCD